MNKISFVLATLVLMFSMTAQAQPRLCALPAKHNVKSSYTKEMLKQASDVNGSWKPVIGNNIYVLRQTAESTIYVLLFYNSNKYISGMGVSDPDPEQDDVRVVFQVKGKECKLLFVDFYAGLDLLTKNVELLIPDDTSSK